MKIVMLSAMYENGGNTTHRMLDGHPNLFVYPFESQVGTGAGNDFLSSYVPIRYRWPEFTTDVTPAQAYEMFWDEELKTLLRVPGRSKFRDCGLQMDEKERIAAFVRACEGRLANRATFVNAYFQSTFEAWKNVRRTGKEQCYVGYNPVQVFDTDKILADFPDGHVIHVVRNPYSGYADTSKRPFPLGIRRYAWTWNLCQHMALTYREKYPERFHLVRFEDLVANPRKTMQGLLARLGLPMADECLHPSFNGVKLEQVYPWGTIRIPTPEANLATANELSDAQKREIRAESQVMQRLLGYENFL
ncbi:MAG TPA: sulfotransferase [Usitatibacter sp.]|nr:sulfotransferase [Usitatibacter sp.]